MATGDGALVRLALLSFAISVLELTSPGGRVTWQVEQRNHADAPSVSITTSQPVLPRGLVDTLFRLSCAADSDYSAAIAGRLIVEAQGGKVMLRNATHWHLGVLLHLPPHA